METKTMTSSTFMDLIGQLDAWVYQDNIEKFTLEYFHTMLDGEDTHTFKITY